MSLKFCRVCGTLYNDRDGSCPKCSAREAEGHSVYDGEMPESEQRRLRSRSWLQLIIGIPAMIGLFYLVFWLLKNQLTK